MSQIDGKNGGIKLKIAQLDSKKYEAELKRALLVQRVAERHGLKRKKRLPITKLPWMALEPDKHNKHRHGIGPLKRCDSINTYKLLPSIGSDSHIVETPPYPDDVGTRAAVVGDLDGIKKPTSNQVRIYLATGPGTERAKELMHTFVAPKVREYLAEKAVSFKMVDCRATYNTDIRAKYEIEKCRRLSMGTNFVVLLCRSLGEERLPSAILSTDYDVIVDTCRRDSPDVEELLREIYQEDANCIPVQYVKKNVADDDDIDARAAKESSLVQKLRKTLRQAVDSPSITADKSTKQNTTRKKTESESHPKTRIPMERATKYLATFLEADIMEGVFGQNYPKGHCLCVEVQGGHLTETGSNKTFTHTDRSTLGSTTRIGVPSLEDRIDSVKADLVTKLGMNNCTVLADTSDPERENNCSLPEKLTPAEEKFVTWMVQRIQSQTTWSNTKTDTSVEEALIHCQMAKAITDTSFGMKTVLADLQTRLANERKPLVLVGRPGYGKTTILASVAKAAHEWFGEDTVVVMRFVGTTPNSSTLSRLIRSLIRHLCIAFRRRAPSLSTQNRIILMQHFNDTLVSVSDSAGDGHVLILIDDLEDTSWLPGNLPDNVHILVTKDTKATKMVDVVMDVMHGGDAMNVAEEEAEIFAGTLIADDIILGFLGKHARTLTEDQLEFVNALFARNPTPMYLVLLLNYARCWRSCDQLDSLDYGETNLIIAQSMVKDLQRNYGEELVKFALGHITCSYFGASETELVNLLHRNPAVMRDFTGDINEQVSQLLADMDNFLTEVPIFGLSLLTWRHHTFRVTADLLMIDCARIHRDLAELYLPGIEKGEGRINELDIRCLAALPFHVSEGYSDNPNIIKRSLFYSLDWLIQRTKLTGLESVIDDLLLFLDKVDDDEVRDLFNLLTSSFHYIDDDVINMCTTIVNRLPVTSEFRVSLRRTAVDYIRKTDPNHQLIPLYPIYPLDSPRKFSILGCKRLITAFDYSTATNAQTNLESAMIVFISANLSGQIVIFSVDACEVATILQDSEESDPDAVYIYCHEPRQLFSFTIDVVKVWHLVSGKILHKFNIWRRLDVMLPKVFRKRDAAVTVANVNNDVTKAWCGTDLGAILIVDIERHAVVRVLQTNLDQIRHIVFAPDSSLVVTTGPMSEKSSSGVLVWENEVMRAETLILDAQILDSVAPIITRSKEALVCACANDLICVVDLQNVELIRLKKPSDSHVVTSLSSMRTSDYMISLDSGSTVRIFENVHIWLNDYQTIVNDSVVTCAPKQYRDDFVILAQNQPLSLKFVHVQSGDVVRTMTRIPSAVKDLRIFHCADYSVIVTYCDDGNLYLWELNDDSLNERPTNINRASSPFRQQARKLAEEADLKSIRKKSLVGLAQVATPARGLRSDHVVTSMTMTLDGHGAVTTSAYGNPVMWNTDDASLVKPVPASDEVKCLYFCTNDRNLIGLQKCQENTSLCSVKMWSYPECTATDLYQCDGDVLMATALTLDNDRTNAWLASTEDKQTVVVLRQLDLQTRQVVKTIVDKDRKMGFEMPNAFHLEAREVKISKDGRSALVSSRILSVGSESSTFLHVMCFLDTEQAYVRGAPCGGMLNEQIHIPLSNCRAVTATSKGELLVWSMEDMQVIRTLTKSGKDRVIGLNYYRYWDTSRASYNAPHNGPINALVISQEETLLAVASSDKTISIWHLPTGALLHELFGHTNEVTCVALSRDQSLLVSGSADQSLCVWRLDDGARVGRYDVLVTPIDVALSPSNDRLVARDTGSVYFFQLEIGHNQNVQ